MSTKKLSIITICYNSPNLEKTCKNIVNQSWQDFEWIVIDGGSNQKTLEILEKYKHRMDYFVSEPDKGIYDAYNKGIRLAKGEYISLMNAGDIFHKKNTLEKIFKNKNYTSGVIYGSTLATDRNNWFNSYISHSPVKFDKYFMLVFNLCTQSTFIKRDLFNKFGTYEDKYKILGDYEKWINFLSNGVEFEGLPIVISDYDLDGISSQSEYQQEMIQIKDKIIRKYFSQDDITAAQEKYSNTRRWRTTFFERVFSIKNTYDINYKVITIFDKQIYLKDFRRSK